MFYQNMMSDISFDNKLYSFVVTVSVCGLFVSIDWHHKQGVCVCVTFIDQLLAEEES